MKWLRRYVNEKEPTFNEFARVARSPEERTPGNARGGP
jgi:hypothetical protein